ncbi:hypothetical protein Pyn_29861 [Prunus yedoensis var. nudiflora]|uniref:Uncharacterized protein n=1 Tax=Prunus yedoensis var. nudiflora TaxID=2094558 RepID=A0A314YQ34_PRUYE|nr:hypothetical protein Pyn_29861 [Prunus yedoensis var. nudiflora]
MTFLKQMTLVSQIGNEIMQRKKNELNLTVSSFEYVDFPIGSQVWYFGNNFESFLIAAVVLDRKALGDLGPEHASTC